MFRISSIVLVLVNTRISHVAKTITGCEKAPIGLVTCSSARHTSENIAEWAKTALLDIGLTAKGLVAK